MCTVNWTSYYAKHPQAFFSAHARLRKTGNVFSEDNQHSKNIRNERGLGTSHSDLPLILVILWQRALYVYIYSDKYVWMLLNNPIKHTGEL